MRNLIWAAGAALGLTGCMSNACTVAVDEMGTSPGGRYSATVEQRDCGATTEIAFVVVIHDRGNMLDPSKEVAAFDHTDGIDARWTGEKQLTISSGGERWSYVETWHGIDIVYE